MKPSSILITNRNSSDVRVKFPQPYSFAYLKWFDSQHKTERSPGGLEGIWTYWKGFQLFNLQFTL